VIRNGALVVSQKFPRNAAAIVGDREKRVEIDRPVEVVDRPAMVSHSLIGCAAIRIGHRIVREEAYDLAEPDGGPAELAVSQPMTANSAFSRFSMRHLRFDREGEPPIRRPIVIRECDTASIRPRCFRFALPVACA
jgi:hypothetical protein